MVKKYKITIVIEGESEVCEQELKDFEKEFKEVILKQDVNNVKVMNFEWKEYEKSN